MNLIIAGDVAPTSTNKSIFEDKLDKKIDKNFYDIWKKSDYRVFNLECPIIENGKPILKFGPNISCSSNCINGIKSLKPDLVLLGNNHINDYGTDGINNTIEILEKENISYTGIIENYEDNNKGFIFDKDGIRVGVYNFCDNEFSIATLSKKGIWGVSLFKNYQEIKQLKKLTAYLLVIFHGGKEYYQYQTPKLKELTELLVEFGADIVICQHSHCIGTYYKYKDSTIVFGQGNFIFDNSKHELGKNSLVIKINFTENEYKIEYIPIKKENELIKIDDSNTSMEEFLKRSNEINKDNNIYKKVSNFSTDLLNNYMAIFSKVNIVKRIINKFFIKNYYVKSYSKEELAKILNIVECEAHREMLIEALKNKIERDE